MIPLISSEAFAVSSAQQVASGASTGIGASATIFVSALLIIFLGLASIAIPYLPAIPILWLGIFLYGVGTNFEVIDLDFLFLISLLGLFSIVLDFIASMWGRPRYRSRFSGIFGAVLGGLIGSLFGNIGAFVVGPVIGAVVAELVQGHDNIFRIESENFTVIGYIGGTLVKLMIGIAIAGLFFWKLLSTS